MTAKKALILAVLGAMMLIPAARAGDETLRVMSWNIRLDVKSDGINAWPNRREDVSALIGFYEPDIIGLQEVLLHQLDELATDLSPYHFVGVGRDDGKEKGEFSPFAYNMARMELIDSGTFWLSETPAKPSTGWDAALPRIATWGRLKDLATGQEVLYLNTHFDHVGEEARLNAARLIRKWLDGHHTDEVVIVTGDFNTPPSAAPYQALTGPEGTGAALIDTKRASISPPFGPAGTFTGFDVTRLDDEPIDYVFTGGGLTVLRYGVITQQEGGLLPSDHYPVLTDLQLPRKPEN